MNRRQTLNFNNNTSVFRIPINEINYIEKVQGQRKCLIYTEDGKVYHVCETLKEVEKQLGPLFYKSHKSFLVNVENIKHINYPENEITFQNNQAEYLISNRCKKGLIDYVEKY
jgi:DNA-binding LytR/AlgR family response regulator